MGRLRKIAGALKRGLKRKTPLDDPEVRMAYNEGKREGTLQEARKSGLQEGSRVGKTLGKGRVGVLPKVDLSRANAGLEYLNKMSLGDVGLNTDVDLNSFDFDLDREAKKHKGKRKKEVWEL